ncbi:hypothetical protein Patl1_08005 [Pistacia atlantica]|uniref:Uncharacterized protein n=1 Tax=Pistacia atlantica TaxID=434234 RepID=A0ACC1AHE7_9ROSI|nr:hypothetical protein Patl1_08005 [Pistacia atlantica]
MAKASAFFASLLLLSSLSLVSFSEAKDSVHVEKGLSWTFYKKSCPKVESIVRKQLKKVFKDDIGQAAGLLRLHFHDCFVQGCDASVLLDGSASGPSEQDAPPNLSLRARAFEIIDDLRALVHKEVWKSCFLRRCCRHCSSRFSCPAPSSNTSVLLTSLATKNFDATDIVALSGGHTIGISHCNSFTDRLYPTQDPTMDKTFANDLKETCPAKDTNNTVVLDIRSPGRLRQQVLRGPDEPSGAIHFGSGLSMLKMGQLSVLTGKQGEIRANCSVRNPDNKKFLASVVEEDVVEEAWAELR